MKLMIAFLIFLLSVFVYGQDTNTSDFTDEIRKHDVSDLWTLDKIEAKPGLPMTDKMDPLGYIGDNYQRFYIHFISAIQNPHDVRQYLIYGKTKVNENICAFQGTITITESKTYDENEFSDLKQGYIKGQYEFFEDRKHKGSGVMQGHFQTNFYINEKGILKYDALGSSADEYNNNQFTGTWTEYKTGNSKKCNWGDGRIPDSGELDDGVSEFCPLEKYEKFGWKNYREAWNYSTNKSMDARIKEQEKWWEEK